MINYYNKKHRIMLIDVAVGNMNYEYNGDDIFRYEFSDSGSLLIIYMKDGQTHEFHNAAAKVTFRS